MRIIYLKKLVMSIVLVVLSVLQITVMASQITPPLSIYE